MKKILVLFTGGTIGSKHKNSSIDVDRSSGYYLINQFHQNCDLKVEFDTVQPINTLSENCTPIHWQAIYDSLKKIDFTHYDGMIITHGSDTLPYTSALLSFLFPDTPIPMLIIGSNYALEDARSNGYSNFCSAVNFIVNSRIPGIFSIFENNNSKNVVYLASRLIEADSYHDQFSTFGTTSLGEMVNGQLNLYENFINPTHEQLTKVRQNSLKESITFSNQIFAIKPYPGLNYDYFQFKTKPKAILHTLYHSGTACTSDSPYSLPNFIKSCTEQGIAFYLNSFKNVESDLYTTSRIILETGAIPLQNISFEAALAKLNIAYNQNNLSPEEFMKKELYFEFLPY